MTPFVVLNVQATLSLIAFALIAHWHISPRLATRPLEAALVPLLWIHVFRYAPLTLYAPRQVDAQIPPDVLSTIAYGDLIAALAALLAVMALRFRVPGAITAVWAFSVVGIGDLVMGTLKAVTSEMYTFYLGWNWYIVTFYIPVLVVSHFMIIQLLIRGRARA